MACPSFFEPFQDTLTIPPVLGCALRTPGQMDPDGDLLLGIFFGYSWYNGYYDDNGRKVEGDSPLGTRMMHTSQVFTVMSNTAQDDELQHIVVASDKFLFDPSIGGYKLNSNFNDAKMNLGRMFGFAYDHKENGAVFSHMAVMYGYALYKRGKSKEAFKVISALYSHCNDFEKNKIYPGIPEYIDPTGRGMYHRVSKLDALNGHLSDVWCQRKDGRPLA